MTHRPPPASLGILLTIATCLALPAGCPTEYGPADTPGDDRSGENLGGPLARTVGAHTWMGEPVTLALVENVTPAGPAGGLELVDPPLYGTVEIAGSATAVYTPGPAFEGVDDFTFACENADGTSALVRGVVAVIARVEFTLDANSGVEPLTVRASAYTPDGGMLPDAQFCWTFGPARECGHVSTHATTTHTFEHAGAFTVALAISLAGVPGEMVCASADGLSDVVQVGGREARLVVTPNDGFSSFGVPGEPFEPAEKTYTLTNGGAAPLEWGAGSIEPWLSLSQAGGTLGPGETQTVTVQIEPEQLEFGAHVDTLKLENLTNGKGSTARSVEVLVNDEELTETGRLSVWPSTGLDATGPAGGPFSPTSASYTLMNTGSTSITWSAASPATWVTLSATGGLLRPSEWTRVVVSLADDADGLPADEYTGAVQFTNQTSGIGSQSRSLRLSVQPQAGGWLTVTPAQGLTSSGPAGGPFSPSTQAYTLANPGGASISWSASRTQNWVSLSNTGGTLAPGSTATVTVSVNTNANGLPPGNHADTVTFTNLTNGSGTGARAVALTVLGPPALAVAPAGGLTSSGVEGGPFSPSSQVYTLTNTGGMSLNWTAAKTRSWVSLSATSGTLAAGATANVTVSINSNANNLVAGSYSDSVTFTNATNGVGNTSRSVALSVTEGGSALPMTTANRTSGMAPLPVIFDAVNMNSPFPSWSSGVIQPTDGDYSKFQYVWNFGDPNSGTWSAGRQNYDGTYPARNEDCGYLAAHVYEQPGTYTARLSVRDAGGTWHEYTQQIQVSAGNWTTYYVSAAGSDSNNGLSTSSPFRTFARAMQQSTANRRILFRRGDTFTSTASGQGNIRGDGPGLIGAYGSGSKPIVTRTHTSSVFYGADRPDWRILDLEVRGNNSTSYNAFQAMGGFSLVQRCDAVQGFGTGYGVANGDVMVADCTFRNNNYGVYSPPRTRVAIVGCDFDQGGGSHFVRTYVTKLLVAHNHFGEDITGSGNHATKVCGNEQPEELPAKYNILADNLFTDPGEIGWICAVGPENANKPQELTDVVIERNVWDLRECTVAKTCVVSRGADRVTVRNNVFLGAQGIAILLDQPVPGFSTWQNWRIYNNTHTYTGSGSVRFLSCGITMQNADICNNIGYYPNSADSGTYIVRISSNDSTFTSNYNAWHAPRKSTPFQLSGNNYSFAQWQNTGRDGNSFSADPRLTNPAGGDLTLRSDSPCRNDGCNLGWVRDDFYCDPRPAEGTSDMGAVEY